jgi:Antibiotic biosynthesis monooxygenase
MYGTIARVKVTRENLDALRDTFAEVEQRPVKGFRGSHVLVPDVWRDEAYLVVFFDDYDSYFANANDPAQHQDYLRMRALLEADPEWIDGEWTSMEPS